MVEGLTRKPKPTRSNMLRNLRSVLDVRPFDEAAAELAGEIAGTLHRTGKTVGPVDPQIAAVAVVHDLALVTSDLGDFEQIRTVVPALRLENWRA